MSDLGKDADDNRFGVIETMRRERDEARTRLARAEEALRRIGATEPWEGKGLMLCKRCGHVVGGDVCGKVDYCAGQDAREALSQPQSQEATADQGKTCASWCGQGLADFMKLRPLPEYWSRADVALCNPACRDASRPLHPARWKPVCLRADGCNQPHACRDTRNCLDGLHPPTKTCATVEFEISWDGKTWRDWLGPREIPTPDDCKYLRKKQPGTGTKETRQGAARAHLRWLAERLVNVYGESPNADFVIRTRKLGEEEP
jgi:hypothetical protein